jgi:acetyl esterase/lipase
MIRAARCPRPLRGLAALVSLLWPAAAAAQAAEPVPTLTRVYRVVGGDSLRAHVFLPPRHRAGDSASAILLFHGGGWSAGEPAWTFGAARRFADSGLVAVAVQYRLSGGAVTPIEAMADACAAFAWIRAQAGALGVGRRVAGYGVSAGGHLVAATVTVGCPDGTAGPDALLLWSPALDIAHDGWFAGLLGGRAAATDLSPAHHVGPRTPPTTIVLGERDVLTPPAGARRYCDALAALGKRCDLHLFPGLGHLLTRNLANQESDFDPDPAARADGIARQHRFLRSEGLVNGGGRP